MLRLLVIAALVMGFVSLNSQIIYFKDSASKSIGCSEDKCEMIIKVSNKTSIIKKMRWRAVNVINPSSWAAFQICDPSLCHPPSVTVGDFDFFTTDTFSFTIDFYTNKGKGNGSMDLLVFEILDSANTVKKLKFSATNTCAYSASVSKPVQKSFEIRQKEIVFYANNQIENFEIYNLMGQVVYAAREMEQSYSLEALNSGTYIIVAKSKGEDIMQKFIIE